MMQHPPALSLQSYSMASLAGPPCVDPAQAERWLAQIFSAKAAQGGVVRRAVGWVDREIGRARFIAEIRARNYHLICTGNQFIVVCHAGPVQMLF